MLDSNAISMLIRRMSAMTKYAEYKTWASISETESTDLKKAKPFDNCSNDKPSWVAIFPKLKNEKTKQNQNEHVES